MKHISVAMFKDRVSEYIAEAEAGEEVIITRHGKPAARLVAMENTFDRQAKVRNALENLSKMRDKMRAEGRTATIDEMIAWKNEGQR